MAVGRRSDNLDDNSNERTTENVLARVASVQDDVRALMESMGFSSVDIAEAQSMVALEVLKVVSYTGRLPEMNISVTSRGVDISLSGLSDCEDDCDDSYVGEMTDREEDPFEVYAENVLSGLETDHNTFASAKVNLFRGGWSKHFAHGADTMMPVAILAEKVLGKGERIAVLEKVKFLKPIKTNLNVIIINGTDASRMKPKGEVVLEGSFVTNSGRKLNFIGVDDPKSPITREGEKNSLPDYFSSKFEGGDEKSGFRFAVGLPSEADDFAWSGAIRDFNKKMGHQALALSTLIDLVTIITSRAVDMSNSRLRVVASVENLVLPENLEKFFSGFWGRGGTTLKIRQLPDEKKITKTGFELTPVEFKFGNQPRNLGSKIIFGATSSRKTVVEFCGKQNGEE